MALTEVDDETPAEYTERRKRAWDEYVAHLDEEDVKIQERHRYDPHMVRSIFNAGFDLGQPEP